MIYSNKDHSFYLEPEHERDIFFTWGGTWEDKEDLVIQRTSTDPEGVELCLYTFDLRLV